jgi:hypothetical protein
MSTVKKIPSDLDLKEVFLQVAAEELPKLFLKLLSDSRFVSQIDMVADPAVAAQKFVANAAFNLVQDFGNRVLINEEKLSASNRKEIEESVALFRKSFSCLAAAIESLPSKQLSSAYESIGNLILTAAGLGLCIQFSEEARTTFRNWQAGAMREAHQRVASSRRKNNLRPAILEATKNITLVDSLKFAESIEEEVCRILGVKRRARGYSSRTIQREISAILKERS